MELLSRLLDHEQDGQRALKAVSQAGGSTGREHGMQVEPHEAQPLGWESGDGGPMDGRALATADQASRQAEHAADELDGRTRRQRISWTFERAFDLRHAAAGRLGAMRSVSRKAIVTATAADDGRRNDRQAGRSNQLGSHVGQAISALTQRWKAAPTIPWQTAQAGDRVEDAIEDRRVFRSIF